MSRPLEQFDPLARSVECSVTPAALQDSRRTLLTSASANPADPQILASTPFAHAAPPIHALYLHVPFCFHKCHYCDFYSIVDDPDSDRQSVFTDRLIAELSFRVLQCGPKPTTIFVGGGTPTLLRVELWERLLLAMHRLRLLDHVTEFTVEANPETVTPELMRVLHSHGVNRTSIGTQSFNTTHLKTLERWHDPASIPRAIDIIRNAGITNLNLDLIFGIPGQTLREVESDLAAALALAPNHLSYYGLTYEPNTAMTKRLEMGQFTPCDEQLERTMFATIMDQLDAAGYAQYELSNYAQRDAARDRRCQHNLNYWHNQNWLGHGPGAASHVAGHRWKNQPHIGKYLASSADGEPPIIDEENLPEERRMGERLMLGLRLNEGVPLDWLHAQLPATDKRWHAIDYVCTIGMLMRENGRLRLTRAGQFVADAVIRELL